MAISTCSGCNQVFNSNGAFDAHRVGGHALSKYGTKRRCLTVEEMVALGWLKNARGRWIVEAYDGPERFPKEPTISDALSNPRKSEYDSRAKF
jgi:hypothetical protein